MGEKGILIIMSGLSGVLTVKDVQEHLHIGKNQAYNLFNWDNTFPSFKIGNKNVILEDKYIEWLNKKSNSKKYANRY